MNLINDAWIPVRRADGTSDKIEPWRITDYVGGSRSPIVAVASPRPDFDGALTQFLIGLLQTTCAPESEAAWWDWRESAPASDVLKKKFETFTDVFYLNRDNGALFMQERFTSDDMSKPHPVSYLLIGAATDSTLKQNIDHFQKRLREHEECLCPACAATALYTLQTFAPSGGGGGEGKFTGIRGGGPLTTLILGQNLWETVWLNIVFGKTFAPNPPCAKVFPWLNVTAFITEKSPVKTVHSDDMDTRHVFWGMPRRIYLDFGANTSETQCLVCGQVTSSICKQYRDRSGGLTYQHEEKVNGKKEKKPSWIFPRHPLSPYNENDSADPKEKRPSAVHPQSGGIGYRLWLGLVENSVAGKLRRLPATVVEQFRSAIREDARIWAFGFDMDNMKARCWYDAEMPILTIDKELELVFKARVEQLVQAASWAVDVLRKRTKDALFGDSDPSGDLGFVPAHFWAATEAGFFENVRQLRDAIKQGVDERPILGNWLSSLRRAALTVFDTYSQTGDFDAVNPRRVALARNDLTKSLNGKKLRDLLGLPQQERSAA
ncbi:MAG: type I-E CRISPR-associated protein Cse1/CasA [Sulfuricaulis sp.]|uniref:type I-E CRISPR-associated protein Cse1/CasA n=1 Tax=Sulfuricaulis sp. TaxID=2003553 RepID=UPI0034A27BEE